MRDSRPMVNEDKGGAATFGGQRAKVKGDSEVERGGPSRKRKDKGTYERRAERVYV